LKRNKICARGFIGPIGDDLPSLVPLVFALVIFFASFYQALSVYNTTKGRFGLVDEALRISHALLGDRQIDNYAEFSQLCTSVNVRGLNFKAGLVELSDSFAPIDIYSFVNENSRIYKSGDLLFACPQEQTERILRDSTVTVHMLPVSYRDANAKSGTVTRPMLMVVVVWE